MSDIKISIIMPVYKVEEYVGKAIESIQAQTLTEWEFLIVDDGTPDKSGIICDEYAKNDSRIQVIHKENGGAPSARNVAIDIAKGEYMYFMDSDDWAEPDMLEDMYQLAKKNQSQLVVTGFFIDTYYDEDNYLSDKIYVDDCVYMTKEEFRKNAYRYFDRNLLYTPWNKLYDAEYIRKYDLKFPKTLWDDFPFNLSVVRNIERVTVTSKPYYHFIRKRAESETAAYRPNMYEKREEEHGWMIDLYEFWNVHDAGSKEMVARRYVERLIGCIENLTNPKCDLSYGEKRRQVKEMLGKQRVKQTVKIAKPKSSYMKVMLVPVKMKNVTLTLLEAQMITFVKTRNTKLFAKLKAGR
ncbi:MAG: glycosyltransferase family 2 protein [Clostridia bacterium]|nr:glycosyltransferase family 2 protein [Clostridia bacterium]